MWPQEIADASHSARQRLLSKLTAALRQERARARSGHWSYDLNRHIALARAVRLEAAALGYEHRDGTSPCDSVCPPDC